MSDNKRFHVQNYYTITGTSVPEEVEKDTKYGEIIVMATEEHEQLFIKSSGGYLVAIPSMITVEDAIGTKAAQSDLTAHTGNDVIHVTAADKEKWNKVTEKADAEDVSLSFDDIYNSLAPDGGIYEGFYKDINAAKGAADAAQKDVDALEKVVEENELVTASALTEIKTGIPTKLSQLTNDVEYVSKEVVATKAAQSDLTAHTGNGEIHVTTADKEKWNKSKSDIDAFMTLADGETLNDALDSLKELQDFITNEADAADKLVKDLSDVSTRAEKGITDAATAQSAADKAQGDVDALEIVVSGKADSSTVTTLNNRVNNHEMDSDIHVSTDEKSKWDQVTEKANQSDLTAHTGNGEIHVTAAEKTRWSAAAQDVEDFFNGALEDGAEQVKDTLKEIQDYINSDASAAAEMTTNIKAAKDAADAAQKDVDALEKVVEENELVTASALTEIKTGIPTKLSQLTNDVEYVSKEVVANLNKRTFIETSETNINISDKEVYYMPIQYSSLNLNVSEIKYGHPYIFLIKSERDVYTTIQVNETNVYWPNGKSTISREMNLVESYFEIQLIKYSESTPWFGVWVEYRS